MCRGPDISSDHFPMITTLGFQIDKLDQRVRSKWKLNKADWQEWVRLLGEADTRNVCGPVDAETGNEIILEKIQQASEATIPRTSGRVNCHRYTSWWDAECSQAVAERRKAKGKLFRDPSLQNLIEYKRREAIAKRITLKKKRKSFEEFVGSLNDETTRKSVWQKIHSIGGKQKRQSNYPIGDLDTTETMKANLFAQHFTRFNENISPRDEIEIKIQNDRYLDAQEELDCPQILESEVVNAIRNCKNTAPGSDGIGNQFFKKMPSKSVDEIVTVFNTSLVSGLFLKHGNLGFGSQY